MISYNNTVIIRAIFHSPHFSIIIFYYYFLVVQALVLLHVSNSVVRSDDVFVSSSSSSHSLLCYCVFFFFFLIFVFCHPCDVYSRYGAFHGRRQRNILRKRHVNPRSLDKGRPKTCYILSAHWTEAWRASHWTTIAKTQPTPQT